MTRRFTKLSARFVIVSAVLLAASAQAAPEYRDELSALTRVHNPVLDASAGPLLQRRLTTEEFRAWVTHAPDARFDAIGEANPVPYVGTGGSPQFANEARGDIFVVEGTSQLVLSVNQNGGSCTGTQCYKILNHNGGAVQSIANLVLQTVGDNYDSIVVWTTFDDYAAAAYYAPLKNDIRGLGVCQESGEQDAIFGCLYDQAQGIRVQGLIFMNSVEMWKQWDQQWGLTYDENDHRSQIYATLGQESAHRWLVGFHFRDPNTNQDSRALLGRDGSHWNLKADANASVMDGLDWVDNGVGFQIIADNDGFAPLDLYAMGLIGPDEVPPFFIVQGAHSEQLRQIYRQFGQTISGDIPDGNDELSIPPIELTGPISATGTKLDLSITEIVQTNGRRVPEVTESNKTFNQAFVLVTERGQTVNDVGAYITQLDNVRRQWEQWFAAKTENRGSMCTALSGECSAPVAEIRDLRVSDDGATNVDGQVQRGETVSAYVALFNTGSRAIPTVNATLSTSDSGVVIESSGAQVSDMPAQAVVESPTAFRVRIEENLPCEVEKVSLHVDIDPAGASPGGRAFDIPIKACEPGTGSSSSSGGASSGGLGGGALPFGPCACAIPSASAPLMGLALMGLVVALRRRR